MSLHSALTGADLHEPKGCALASANNHYVSDGAGSGGWQKLKAAEVDGTSIFGTNKFYMTVDIADVSTAETVYRVVPFAGTLISVYTILQAAITVADSTLTVRNDGGASAGTITVATAGSAAGDIDILIPAVNNTFTAGQKISIATDGGSTTAARLFITLIFTVTG